MAKGIAFLLTFFLVLPLFAKDKSFTPAATGISRPGKFTGFLGIENPAGIAKLDGGSISVIGQGNSDFDNRSYTGMIAYGTGEIAAGLGASGSEVNDFETTTYNWAIGADKKNGFKMGLGGSLIDGSGPINAGITYELFKSLTVGLVGYDIADSVVTIGAGLSLSLSDEWVLVADAFIPREDGDNTYWGALMFSSDKFEISAGARYKNSGGSEDVEGVYTVGIILADHIILQYFHQYQDEHTLNLTYSF